MLARTWVVVLMAFAATAGCKAKESYDDCMKVETRTAMCDEHVAPTGAELDFIRDSCSGDGFREVHVHEPECLAQTTCEAFSSCVESYEPVKIPVH